MPKERPQERNMIEQLAAMPASRTGEAQLCKSAITDHHELK
jgi:hypothetical protein